MYRKIRRIAVIGGGAMGGGIAALCARRSLELKRSGQTPGGMGVLVREATELLADKAREQIQDRFAKWRKLGKVTDDEFLELCGSVANTSHLERLADFDPDIVIEAIVEKKEAKDALFRQLDRILSSDVIFASNTSTIPITELAMATDRPDRFIGMHFFNPPTTMQLVELIPGERTSEETVDSATAFAGTVLGKTVIRVKDQPGFLVNRLLLPYLTEAVLALQEYDGFTFDELDTAATDIGWPMGPFKLLDTVGVDVAYYAGSVVAAHRAELVMPWLFEFMVGENRLGDKSGSGFYKTAPGQKPLADVLCERFPGRESISSHVPHVYRTLILSGMLREAVIALQDGVASAEDIETGAQLGLGCPGGGPLHIVDAMGPRMFRVTLERWGRLGPRFSVPKLLEEMADNGERFFSSW